MMECSSFQWHNSFFLNLFHFFLSFIGVLYSGARSKVLSQSLIDEKIISPDFVILIVSPFAGIFPF